MRSEEEGKHDVSLNVLVIRMNPLAADRADVNLALKSVPHRVIKQRKIEVSCWRGVPRLLQPELLPGVGACRRGDGAASRGDGAASRGDGAASRGAARLTRKADE
jgi:hypothetical protein